MSYGGIWTWLWESGWYYLPLRHILTALTTCHGVWKLNAPVFFFTAEDPREVPKGSRDPLRFLPVWSRVAREMIPYLTTVTPSYRGFLTRFMFHGLLEDLAPALAHASIDEQWPAFCKFEQLCALVRSELSTKTPNFPGITGITDRCRNGEVTIGSETQYWLVRSQKNTGYWGYYHQASFGSGLLQANKAARPGYRLSDEALEQYLKSDAAQLMRELAPVLENMLTTNRAVDVELGVFTRLAELFASMPLAGRDPEWGNYWQQPLLIPANRADRTLPAAALAAFAREVQTVTRDSPGLSVGEVWGALANQNREAAVKQFADRVASTEAVIGLCEWVFDACRLRLENNRLSETVQWASENGYSADWLDRLRGLDEPESPELLRFRTIALGGGNTFEVLARALLCRHKEVMNTRNGPAWVEL